MTPQRAKLVVLSGWEGHIHSLCCQSQGHEPIVGIRELVCGKTVEVFDRRYVPDVSLHGAWLVIGAWLVGGT